MAQQTGKSPDKNELTFYLVSRFIAVLLLVMIVEAPLLWLFLNVFPAVQKVVTQRALLTAINFFMLLMLVAPPVLGALAFSRVVSIKLRSLQEQREAELARTEQQRNQFMTDIAHDLRTPIMAIQGMAQALRDDMVLDEDMRQEYLDAIYHKAGKLSDLVSTVFDYTKLGGGSFALKREEVDLSQLMLNEAALVYTDVEDAGMSLSIHVPEEPCTVYADPAQLARVIANLLANAVSHNDPGSEISLMLIRRAGVAFAVVADTGEHITGDPSVLFEPFALGDDSRSQAEDASGSRGHGLGLSICKRIAELHGYDLSVVQPYGRFSKAFVLTCTTL